MSDLRRDDRYAIAAKHDIEKGLQLIQAGMVQLNMDVREDGETPSYLFEQYCTLQYRLDYAVSRNVNEDGDG